jgi:hypothetical protein
MRLLHVSLRLKGHSRTLAQRKGVLPAGSATVRLDALLAALELCSLVQIAARAILSRMKADSFELSGAVTSR